MTDKRAFATSAVVAIMALQGACREHVREGPSAPRATPERDAAMSSSTCGASFRMITFEDDEIAATYGWPAQADTVDICETWLGSDYRWEVFTVGTSEEQATTFYDLARDGLYEAGWLSVKDQGVVLQRNPVGATLFETVNADASLQAAAEDDPYYALRSLDVEPTLRSSGASSSQASTAVANKEKYTRHGIRRRGVRALVEEYEEDGVSSEGYRRFTKQDGRGKHVILIDRARNLLVGQEDETADEVIVTRHFWSQRLNGHVRERSEVEAFGGPGKRELMSHVTLLFTNVRVTEP